MFCVSPRLFRGRTRRSTFVFAGILSFIVLTANVSLAQRTRTPPDEPENQPAFSDFKGVRLGMTADEARKKLGNPRDKSAEQDFLRLQRYPSRPGLL